MTAAGSIHCGPCRGRLLQKLAKRFMQHAEVTYLNMRKTEKHVLQRAADRQVFIPCLRWESGPGGRRRAPGKGEGETECQQD